jgi:alginate O-acetyltransferase complex protein AlgI
LPFDSLKYIIFFLAVFFVYYLIPGNYRYLLLILSGIIFLLFSGFLSLIVLMISTTIYYLLGVSFGMKNSKYDKLILFTGVFTGIALIISYRIINSSGSIIILLGLSYYSFTGISYIIETYRDNLKKERNILKFLNAMILFPKLSAGPIERTNKLLPQFNNFKKFDYDNITDGLKLITWGFFKKLVISNRLAIVVNQVYDSPDKYQGYSLIIATLFLAFQIYADFSGYTDIALGSAQMLGFNLTNNFKRPYFSKSISEFWTRWHITLSGWLRDYVFLPTAYLITRHKKFSDIFKIKIETISYLIAVLVTMMLIGLWHGFGWTFLAWGLLHAFFMIFALITKKIRKVIPKKLKIENSVFHNTLKIIITFILIAFAWITFRAWNINDASYIITHLFQNLNFSAFKISISNSGLNYIEFGVAILSIIFLLLLEYTQSKVGSLRNYLSRKNLVIRWFCYSILVISILIFGNFSNEKFIYLKF